MMEADTISSDEAAVNYSLAGELVPEDEDQISLQQYGHLLRDDVALIIKEVLEEHPIPFELKPFQLVALHALGSKKNVILISPTGSGKMMVVYLGTLVLEKVFKVDNGVGIGSQPLSSIMEEKTKKPFIPTGSIAMSGSLKSSTEDGDDLVLSDAIDDFKSRKIKTIIGHAESWLTETAKAILDNLRRLGLIVLTFLDEYHQGLSGHWEDFRREMKFVPGQLRGRTLKGTPCLAMTATSTLSEITEVKSSLGLREDNTVILESSPIQSHFKFVRLQRPANIYGTFGKETDLIKKPVLIHTLQKIYLDQYIECVKQGLPVKKAIIFFRKLEDLLNVYEFLCQERPEQASDPYKCPFVQNHTSIGPITADHMNRRRNDISVFLTTSVMLMGLDLVDIDLVIMARPFSMLHSVVQAAGRRGRNLGNKMRKNVLFYLLFNLSDIGDNVPGMSQAMKDFCLKRFMMEYFGSGFPAPCTPNWCCSSCDRAIS